MTTNIIKELEPLFYPTSVAILGVSSKDDSFGNWFLRALRDFGYRGKIFPIHSTSDEIEGMKAYPSILDIPEMVDLVYVSAPAKSVPKIISDCVVKGVRAVEIFTAGFKELGNEGSKLEQEIIKIAKGRLRIVGPNCFGVYSPAGGLTILPGAKYPKEGGNIGVISQSGGWVNDFILGCEAYNLRFSKVISYGNGIDLNEVSLLEYFAQDPNTKIIAAYLEGINDGKRFTGIVKSLRGKKPVIIWKGGLSETGRKAVNSHTGSLAGSREIWDAFFRQTGAVQVDNFEELVDATAIFNYLPPGKYRNLALIGGGGGVCVAASDVCERYGLKMPPSSSWMLEQISRFLPNEGISAKNPYDIGSPMTSADILGNIMEIIERWDNLDASIINRLYFYGMKEITDNKVIDQDERVAKLVEVKKRTKKPILVVLDELAAGLDKIDVEIGRRKVRDAFLKAGIFVAPTLPRIALALSRFTKYWEDAE